MSFIEQYKPWFDENEIDAVVTYMRGGGYLTEFKKTQEFAERIRDFTGAKYCSIYANGTVTLSAALIALGITNKTDEVIVPAYTMIATANAVVLAGATPVFADVERSTICLEFQSFKSAVTRNTKAVMLVSINGRYPQGLNEILHFCQERNIAIIEDAAQSLGCWYEGKHVGTYGAIGSFSFSMPKIITTGQGGALITDDPEIHRKLELIKNFGRESAGVDKHIFFGLNFKFTDLQAVIGIEQTKKLNERIPLKKQNYKLLRQLLKDTPQVEFIVTNDDVTPWFNDIIVDEPVALQAHLKSHGIGSRPFYPAIHKQAPYHQFDKIFTNSEYFATHGLWLPSFAQLSSEETHKIADSIKEFFSK